jgi:uncharacterized protein (DUF58 family)
MGAMSTAAVSEATPPPTRSTRRIIGAAFAPLIALALLNAWGTATAVALYVALAAMVTVATEIFVAGDRVSGTRGAIRRTPIQEGTS